MIIVNARFLTQPVTGVQRVGIEWSKILKKSKLNVKFVTPKNIIHNKLAEQLEAEVIGNFTGHIWEQFDLFNYVKKNKEALLLSFSFTGPLLYKNQIITVYDLGFKIHPEWFSWKFRLVYNFLVPILSKRVKCILTDSEVVKKEIMSEYGIISNKIYPIHLGVSNVFLKDKDKSIHNKDDNYILTVSSHHPRKNYKKLIEAFNLLEDKNVKLYVVGNIVSHFSNSIEFDKVDVNRVKFLQGIDDNELMNYYRGSKLFIFASLYEGFGIPVIEAISQSIPCIVSDIPVFREICRRDVDFFDPSDAVDIAKVIDFRLKNPISESILQDRKNYVVETFTWDKGAQKVIDILNNYIK